MGAARLEVVAGNAAGTTILVEDELVIGRHAEGAGRLADDEEISRSHARVSLDASGFCAIEDLGSTNGTFVNGLRISAPMTLSEGDTIEVGGTTLIVRDLVPPEPEPEPAPAGTAETTLSQRQPTLVTGAPCAPEPPAAAPEPPAAAPEPPAAALPEQPAAALPEQPAAALPEQPRTAATEHPPAAVAELAFEDAAPATLSLRLRVDFAAREAWLSLDEDSQPLHLVFAAGQWRAETPDTRNGERNPA
jgi:pSer/pThr/pTyr-binding forkhead associated (FHA) protein